MGSIMRKLIKRSDRIKQKIFEFFLNNIMRVSPNRELTDDEITNTIALKELKSILQFKSKTSIPKYGGTEYFIIKCVFLIIVYAILDLILDASLMFTVIGLFITLITFYIVNVEECEENVEIRFYSDYLVVHKKESIFSKTYRRRTYDKINYSDITKVRYDKSLSKFVIYGKFNYVWYEYENDGRISEEPFYAYEGKEAMSMFYDCGNIDLNVFDTLKRNIPTEFEID